MHLSCPYLRNRRICAPLRCTDDGPKMWHLLWHRYTTRPYSSLLRRYAPPNTWCPSKGSSAPFRPHRKHLQFSGFCNISLRSIRCEFRAISDFEAMHQFAAVPGFARRHGPPALNRLGFFPCPTAPARIIAAVPTGLRRRSCARRCSSHAPPPLGCAAPHLDFRASSCHGVIVSMPCSLQSNTTRSIRRDICATS